jgi:hypothetical protein
VGWVASAVGWTASVAGVVSAGLLPQAAKLSSIARVRNSAKIFFISNFVLSFFGRTVYNICACLYFAIWVGTPRCGASHTGASCIYYIDIFIMMEAPLGDGNFLYRGVFHSHSYLLLIYVLIHQLDI